MNCAESLSPISNQLQISPHSINTHVHTHEKVVKIKEVITKEKLWKAFLAVIRVWRLVMKVAMCVSVLVVDRSADMIIWDA